VCTFVQDVPSELVAAVECTFEQNAPSELVTAAGVDDRVHTGVDPAQPGHHAKHNIWVLKNEEAF
jgi:hypothetical protein